MSTSNASDPGIALNLSKSDFLTVLKSCHDRYAKLDRLRTFTKDEDQIADAENDLIAIRMLIDQLEALAEKTWPGKWSLSEEYL